MYNFEFTRQQFNCFVDNLNISRNSSFCGAIWDGYACWPPTQSSKEAVQNCPSYLPRFNTEGISDFVGREFAVRPCQANGEWFRYPTTQYQWTNYSRCQLQKGQEAVWAKYRLAISGYSVSMITLLVALFIFFHFRSLQCQRVTMHKHLFVSYILNALASVLWLHSHTIPGVSQVYCKFLHAIHQYTETSNYFWMLCEGIYLHTLVVVSVFREKQNLLIYTGLGWGFPALSLLLYVVTRFVLDDSSCWATPTTDAAYIIHGPIAIALVINFIILMNLLRVLLSKLRANRNNIQRYIGAIKATLVLIPLLGSQHILLTIALYIPNASVLRVLSYITNVLSSFQGFAVAIIFCFCHEEVGRITSLSRSKSSYHVDVAFLSLSNKVRAASVTTLASRLRMPPKSN
uniref:Calcitonin receptor n=1 Tax=Ciona intestinalis TaxID=7719 RepID=F6ZUZ5_CIOIN